MIRVIAPVLFSKRANSISNRITLPEGRNFSTHFSRYAEGVYASGVNNSLINELYINPRFCSLASEVINDSLREHICSESDSPFTIYHDDFSEKILSELSKVSRIDFDNSPEITQTIGDLITATVTYFNSELGANIKIHSGRKTDNDLVASVNNQNLPSDGWINLRGRYVKTTYIPGLGSIPLLDGVMKAKNSTGSFIALIRDIATELKDKKVFQIGPNHGAITKVLSEFASSVTAPDVLKEAIDNTNETLDSLEKRDRDKVKLILNDLACLEEEAKTSGRADFLFFNCPIFRGENDPNSMAGNDFELVKRSLKLLPKVLTEKGEAYMLVGYPETKNAQKFLWTPDKLKAFLSKEMPEWTFVDLPKYESAYNEHGTYGIVKINRKAVV